MAHNRRRAVMAMKWNVIGLGMSCSMLGAAALSPSGQSNLKPTAPRFEADAVPLIRKYCGPCHTGSSPPAGINLVQFKTTGDAAQRSDVWERVARVLRSSHMPPQGAAQPSPAERKRISNAVDALLATDCKISDPGRVTIRRLNREEYNNTVRDLVGVDFRPADDFPSDDVGYGFDNIGDVLSLSPLLLEKYLSAAEQIADKAIVTSFSKTVKFDLDALANGQGFTEHDRTGKVFFSNGVLRIPAKVPVDGTYHLRASAWGQLAGEELPKMALLLDGKIVQTFDVRNADSTPGTFEVPIQATRGDHVIGVAFTNDYYNPSGPVGDRDRNLGLDSLELLGPMDASIPLPASHLRIIPHRPSKATQEQEARPMIGAFATRAFRRPVTTDELDRLMKVFRLGEQQGQSFESCMQLAVEAVLVSPNFLYRVELDSRPNDAKSGRDLNDYELASRLSYFLWSSMPDDALFSLAAQGKLHVPAVLDAQIARMLKSLKARALADNFAGQWLQLRKLAIVAPDPAQFPGFNDKLREDMATETKLFFLNVVNEDRTILDFIDARYTFVNQRLAEIYGLPAVSGSGFRKIELQDPNRGGVLTQASVLTVTSNPTRTSPTKRGKWVLEEILGTPPPPPPPGVGNLGTDEKTLVQTHTLRELMEQHRKKPECAPCHAMMDPIGFGLENFGPIGQWRANEGQFPVDASGTLSDGRKFRGPAELKAILMQRKEQFARCLSEKLLTYALGRGLESYDKCAVDDVVKATVSHGYRFSAMIGAIARSDPFRKRRGDGTVK